MNSLLQVIIGQMLITDSKVVKQISIKLVRDLWEAHQLLLCPTQQGSELRCHQQKTLVSNWTILYNIKKIIELWMGSCWNHAWRLRIVCTHPESYLYFLFLDTREIISHLGIKIINIFSLLSLYFFKWSW